MWRPDETHALCATAVVSHLARWFWCDHDKPGSRNSGCASNPAGSQRHPFASVDLVVRTNMTHVFKHSARMTLALLALVPALTNCIPRPPGGGPNAGGPNPEDTPEGKACPADGVVDDGEDNNNQILAQKGRGG